MKTVRAWETAPTDHTAFVAMRLTWLSPEEVKAAVDKAEVDLLLRSFRSLIDRIGEDIHMKWEIKGERADELAEYINALTPHNVAALCRHVERLEGKVK